MQRWKQEFVGSTDRKCVQINRNGVFDQGREADWDCQDLLHSASQRLEIIPAAQKIFNADGNEIDDCMMICDDDILFFSKGEPFIAPESVITDSTEKGKGEGERLPHSVGGYKVCELLGRGGFGEVRLGDHQLTGEKVALKFLRKAEIHSLGAAERTNTEIQCLATLKHHNIIKLLQHLETASHVVLVFELMAGGDLLKFLIRRGAASPSTAAGQPPGAPNASGIAEELLPAVPSRCVLTEDEARHVFYQLLSAISYAHNQHICHRDLKLENILLKDNSLSLVKIADFGLSDFYRPGATMKSSCGTLSFLAPEVFRGTANAGPPLDVWSMGIILFAMLCGRLPFEGPDLIGTKRPREQIIKSRISKCQYKVDDSLGLEAKDLIRRMLQPDPSERASIPELFNHAWVRPAVSGNLSEAYHLQSLSAAVASVGASRMTTNPDAGNLFPSNAPTRQGSLFAPDPPTDGLAQKPSRHRQSFSLNGISGLGGRTLSARSVASSNDLAELEAQAHTPREGGAEQSLPQQISPPLSARGISTESLNAGGGSRSSQSRLLLSPPARDSLSFDKQPSLSGSEAFEPVTPRGNGNSALSSSPFTPLAEDLTPNPTPVPNKAFKLVPLRKQLSDGLSGSETGSPSAKARSNSASDALNAAGLSALQRPITGRLHNHTHGQAYNDFDDDDDSFSLSNWRNITLDPSPSVPALTPSVGSRKGGGSTSGKHSAPARRESMLHARASSSSSLGGGTGPIGSPNTGSTKERSAVGSGASSSASTGTMSRVSASAVTAAAALASMSISGKHLTHQAAGSAHHAGQRDGHGTGLGHGSSVASHTGIAAINSNMR